MNERMNEWKNEWKNEWMKEWMTTSSWEFEMIESLMIWMNVNFIYIIYSLSYGHDIDVPRLSASYI